MENKKIDQRVKLTKSLLENALVNQMATQHISKISVRALCDEAGINRSTFYAHYSDQYALLQSLEHEVMTNLDRYLHSQAFSDSRPISAQMLNIILDYVKENANLFKALLSENCDFAFQGSILQLAEIVTSQIGHTFDARIQAYLQSFGVMGCLSVLQKWLQDGMVESTQVMTEFILQVLYHGVLSIK